MAIYMTDVLTGKKCDEFISWFDSEIGTETDIDDDGEDGFTVTCLELERNEVSKCRYFETHKLPRCD